jgi:hypothetical protein
MYADATFDILATAQRIREVATEAARKAAGVGLSVTSGHGGQYDPPASALSRRTQEEKDAGIDQFGRFIRGHSIAGPPPAPPARGISREVAEGPPTLAQLDRFMVGGGIPRPAPSKE